VADALRRQVHCLPLRELTAVHVEVTATARNGVTKVAFANRSCGSVNVMGSFCFVGYSFDSLEPELTP
jgi:hypothetical protein